MTLWWPIALAAALLQETPAPIEQPIPFSHRAHAAVGVKCVACHPLRAPARAAGLPSERLCMSCHETVLSDSSWIRELAAHARAGTAVRWRRVYELPDYVWFSHGVHHREAGIECEACHGPVAERDVLAREEPITMQSCMACHARRGASNDCGFCHNPN